MSDFKIHSLAFSVETEMKEWNKEVKSVSYQFIEGITSNFSKKTSL